MNPMAKEIFPAEAFAKSKQGALFVDVREKSELEAEAYDVPNLLHIPLGELELRFAEIPNDQDVVIVCRGGVRSLRALHFLIGQGYVNAANMKQGILGWMREGFPVHKGYTLTQNMGFIGINQL
jgi:rhodanese-related sulfurtransferase